MSITLLFLFSFLLYCIYFYRIFRKRYPSGPWPLPFIGNLYHIRPDDLHKYLDKLEQQYGPCYTLFLPSPTVVLTSYETIREALIEKGEIFSGRTHRLPEVLLQRFPNTGLIIADGEGWLAHRQFCIKVFRTFGMGRNLMEDKVHSSVAKLLSEFSEQNGNGFDPTRMLQLCVGNVINEFLFGFSFDQTNCNHFFDMVDRIAVHMRMIKDSNLAMMCQAFPFLQYIPVFRYYGYTRQKENISKYHSAMESLVAEQMNIYNRNIKAENFVHAYLQEMRNGERLMSLENLNACCGDIWLAGVESTSTVLRWFIAYMINYPDVQEKMHREIHEVIGDDVPQMEHRKRMIYSQAVLHEVQRHCNMLPFLNFHRSTEDTRLCGQYIPKDTIVMAQVWSILNGDPHYKNPNNFQPERFLSKDGKTLNKTLVERNAAFGMGYRKCVGESMARMQIWMIAKALIQRFKFTSDMMPSLEPEFTTILCPKPFKCKVLLR